MQTPMRSLLLALMLVLPVLPAAAQQTIEIPASVVVEAAYHPTEDECITVAFAEFDDVPGATQYVFHGFYGLLQVPITRVGPPFYDHYENSVYQFEAPSGRHRLLLQERGPTRPTYADPNYCYTWKGIFESTWVADYVSVTLDDDPPTASFTWQESSTQALTLDVDASSSSDPDGPIAAYTWAFGDGQGGSGVQTSHTYAEAGTYTVKLTVRDAIGQEDTATEQVEARFAEMRYIVSLETAQESLPARKTAADEPVAVRVGEEVLVRVRIENTGVVPINDIQLPAPPEILSTVEALALVEIEKPLIAQLAPGASDELLLRYEAVQLAQFTVFVAKVEGRAFNPAKGDSVQVQAVAGACTMSQKTADDPEPSVGCADGQVNASALVVNSVEDRPRGTDEDGISLPGCDTGETITRDGQEEAECTLRAAIEAVNAGDVKADEDGKTHIMFDIPGSGIHILPPQAALPPLDQSVVIDGTTQPGYDGSPVIELDGAQAGPAATGLIANASGTIIKAVAVYGFGTGLLLAGRGMHVVESCYIGTNAAGASGPGNSTGIEIRSTNNRIGGAERTPGHCDGPCNVIAGNSDGLSIRGEGSTGNTVMSNFIGLDAQGQALGNSESGVFVVDAEANTFGGTEPGMGNVVAGNGGSGFFFTGHTRANVLLGNTIGTNEAYSTDERLHNGGDGISFLGARDHEDAVIGQAGAGNVIGHNALHGIRVDHGVGFVIQGNYIGTTPDLRRNLGNSGDGIDMGGAKVVTQGNLGEHQVGGLETGQPNVVAFNAEAGISLDAAGQSAIRGNIVADNGGSGLILSNSDKLEVVGNTLVGNEHGMVLLRVTESEIVSNLVGTDLTDGPGLGNREDGIHGLGAIANLFSLNTIAGNGGNGLCLLAAGDAGKTAAFGLNRIIQNLIGAFEGEGAARLLPNEKSGICLQHTENNLVEGNTIVGNRGGGVEVSGSGAVGNRFFSNVIGTFSLDALNPTFVNVGPALRLLRGSHGTLLGGPAPGQGNVLVTTHAHAVQVEELQGELEKTLEMYQNIIRRLDTPGDKTSANDPVDGVHVEGSTNLRIGMPEAPNDIAGFDNGVYLRGTRNAEVAGNRMRANDTGIRLDGSTAVLIANNLIQENCTGILGEQATTTIIGNRIEGSTCPASGIHLEQSGGGIVGNTVTGDAGDAVTLLAGSDPLVTQNNLFGNAGFGLRNLDALVQVAAPANWWGDASGPSGTGDGSGDAVSEGVDFSGWLAEHAVLAVAVSRDTVEAAAGSTDSVLVYVQRWAPSNDALQVTVSDTQGWIETPATMVMVADTMGGSTAVRFRLPQQAAGETSDVQVQVTSTTNPSWQATTAFVIRATPAISTAIEAPEDNLADDGEIPATVILEANYPNPFNPSTHIVFALPVSSDVRLAVYDVLGREVAVLIDGVQQAGRHAAIFEADALPSGVYIYQLAAGGFIQARQAVLVK